MSKPKRFLIAVAAFAAAYAFLAKSDPARAERQPLPELHIGSDAPPLDVMKFVKGGPVKQFEKGQVYVVEFWATWCGPCIQAMPHITELAKTYEGRATMIGVSISERVPDRTEENLLALVEPFVENQGDRMGYVVAVDGPEQEMAKTWFRAAGRSGIPSTFIVNQDKKIAWLGHPMEMDKVLAQVVDGTWDLKAAAEKQAKDWEREQDLQEALAPVIVALRARDHKAIVEAIDAAIVKMPEIENEVRPMKFESLLRTDEPAAYAYMKDQAQKKVFEKNPTEAYNFWLGMNRTADGLQSPDWATLGEIMEKANAAMDKPSPPMLTALAAIYDRMSKFDKAVETQKKAIEAAEQADQKPPAAWLELQKKKLAEYEAKL